MKVGREFPRFPRRKWARERTPPVPMRSIRDGASQLPKRSPTCIEDRGGVDMCLRREHKRAKRCPIDPRPRNWGEEGCVDVLSGSPEQVGDSSLGRGFRDDVLDEEVNRGSAPA